MIRKQVYIEAKHQHALARQARREGTSEAAVIRRALETASRGGAREVPDAAAWREAVALMRSLSGRGGRRSRRAWRREDLYEERLGRYGRHSG